MTKTHEPKIDIEKEVNAVRERLLDQLAGELWDKTREGTTLPTYKYATLDQKLQARAYARIIQSQESVKRTF